MGVLAVGVGKIEEALPFFKTALEANPDIGQFWLSYADALIKLNRIAEAKAAFNWAKDKGANSETFDQLEQQLSEQSMNSQNPPLDQLQPIINLYTQGQLQQALSEVSEMLERFPNSVVLYNIAGASNMGLMQFDTAIESYKQALKINPDYAKTYNNMGNALRDKGDLEAAIDSYQRALKIKPDYANAYYNMGNSLKDKGSLEAAIDSFKQALKIKPDFAEAYNSVGVALNDKGDSESAIDSYKNAIKIKPDYADAYINMGNVLSAKGGLEAAINSYKQALKFKPDSVKAHIYIGNVLNNRGDLEAALGNYKKAISINPNLSEAWNNLEFPLQAMKQQVPSVDKLLSRLDLQTDSKHFQIEKSILSFRLRKGGKNAQIVLNKVCSLLSKVGNKTIRNLTITKKKSHPQIIGPEKTVALVHFGRSGTGLLHSLIDGHPEVSTMPSIYFSEFFKHSSWEKIIAGGWDEMANRFIETYEVLFDASARKPIESQVQKFIDYCGQKDGMANVGDQRDEVLRVDKALFREELKRLMDIHDHLDAYVFFKLVHSAYDKALNDMSHKSLIFYHIHNPDTHAQLNFVHAVPNANWVMMVREPIQACESWVRSSFHNNEYFSVSAKIIAMFFEVDSVIYQKKNAIGVRLEDLKESPRKTIPALCDWMGIEESESLYEMTAQGKKWWGDPGSPDYTKDGMEPFGKTSIRRKIGAIFSENDQFILHTLFYPFSVRFGYAEKNLEQFKVDLQTIRPMLNEMFGFEKTIAERTQVNADQFMKSGSYLYLRSGLIERWNVLAEFNTYPNMIEPL